MWDNRDRTWKRLTRDTYAAAGVVVGALASHADTVFDSMTADRRGHAKALLLRCVTEEHTRAVVPIVELTDAIDGAQAILDVLVEARLVVVRQHEEDERVELAHEALISHWDRLRGWLADDDALQRAQARVGAAAARWERDGEPSDRLLGDGKPILEALELLSARRDALRAIEVRFIERSQAQIAKSRRLRSMAVTALGVLTVLAVVFGAAAWWARQRAQTMQSLAEVKASESTERAVASLEEQGRRELIDGRPSRAALFFVEARRLGSQREALRMMLADAMRSVDSHLRSWPTEHAVETLRFIDDELLAIDRRGRFVSYRWRDGSPAGRGDLGDASTQIDAVADGSWVAGTRDGQVKVFDPDHTLRWQAQLRGRIVGLTISDTEVAAVSGDGTLRRWDRAGSRIASLTLASGSDGIADVAFNASTPAARDRSRLKPPWRGVTAPCR